ncbi:NERD domain-containing protein, partial [Pseudoalteromonas tunicata]|uniref:NERD domain-containing protein n=1 Tax=Pseudoalteromonas tunicata TaxID=314281 RepID=UPI00273FFDAB
MRLIKFLLFMLILNQSFCLYAAPNKEAQCLLLNQQMNQFSYAPNSSPYKQAKRAYDRECKNLTNQAAQTTADQATVNSSAEVELSSKRNAEIEAQKLLEAQKQAALKKEQEELAQAQARIEQEELAQQTALKQAQLKESYEAEKQLKEQPKAEQAAVKQQAQTALKLAPVFVAEPVEQISLIDQLMLPSIIVLILIIIILVLLKWVRPRMSQFKQQASLLKEKTIQASQQLKEKAEQTRKPKSGRLRTKNQLDRDIYSSYKQLGVSLESGAESKIERVIVSSYGVFVVIFPSQQGAIFGTQAAAQWSEQINGETLPFENPLQSATRQTFALGRLLDLNEGIKTIVVFNDAVVFKSPMPENVIHRADMFDYIQSFKHFIYMDEQVEQYNEILTQQFNQQNTVPEPELPLYTPPVTVFAPEVLDDVIAPAEVEPTRNEGSDNFAEQTEAVVSDSEIRQELLANDSEVNSPHHASEQREELEPFISPAEFIEQIDGPSVENRFDKNTPQDIASSSLLNDEFDENESQFSQQSRNSDLFAKPRADYLPQFESETNLTNNNEVQDELIKHKDSDVAQKEDFSDSAQPLEKAPLDKTPSVLNTETDEDERHSIYMQNEPTNNAEQLDEVSAFLSSQVGEELARSKRSSYLAEPQFKEPVVREYKPDEPSVDDVIQKAQVEVTKDPVVEAVTPPETLISIEPEDQKAVNATPQKPAAVISNDDTSDSLEFKPLPIAKDLKPLVRNEPKGLYSPEENELQEKKDLFANLSLDPNWGVPNT